MLANITSKIRRKDVQSTQTRVVRQMRRPQPNEHGPVVPAAHQPFVAVHDHGYGTPGGTRETRAFDDAVAGLVDPAKATVQELDRLRPVA